MSVRERYLIEKYEAIEDRLRQHHDRMVEFLEACAKAKEKSDAR